MGATISPSGTPAGIQFARETQELQDKVLRAKAAKEQEDVKLGGEVDVDPAHAPWLRPPEITQAGNGAWTTFREQDDEETNSPFMLELGKKNTGRKLESGEVMFWDRVNNRRLIFESAPSMPAGSWLTTGRAFGRPVPHWPFKNVAHKVLKEERWSRWMYSSERPHPADVGRLPLAPEARYLPTVSKGQFEEGKGEWVRRDDDSDGGVSLGPPSDGEPGAGDAMDVDDGVPAPPKAGVEEHPLSANANRKWTPYQPLISARSPPRRPRSLGTATNPPPSILRPARSPPSLNNTLASASRAPMDWWTPRMGPTSHTWRYPTVPPLNAPSTPAPPASWSRPNVRPPPPAPPAVIGLKLDCQPMTAGEFYGVDLPRVDGNLTRRAGMTIVRDPEALERGGTNDELVVLTLTRDLRCVAPVLGRDLSEENGEGDRALLREHHRQLLPPRPFPPGISYSAWIYLPVEDCLHQSFRGSASLCKNESAKYGRDGDAAKRAKKEAERVAKLREDGLVEEDDRNLQTALLLDAASQPAPTPAPPAPYVLPDYPEDWYA
ncbi:hypothetical protein B0H16DRAFT_1455072 [Mycena metata]|uniref:Uncharacterized protein n=1 Tax=Mycena metata TaxID=1033252 RepID=A0AAD7JI20_9AGAR|nr:hypothetical protein B0H16DRAFT_1455072 [Mycena metata]